MDTKRPTNPLAEEILGLYFPVLDHGFVSLVDYMGSDEDVERAARVSYGQGTRPREKTRGLVRHLRRHRHTTPSEMVELKFHCCMPIFIARQWIRHRTANVNEMSGRYSLLPMLFYMSAEEQLRKQSKSNKQGRSDEGLGSKLYVEAVERWESGRERVQADYEWLTVNDMARELARIDLPLSTYTQWYWKIDLHNLMHFLGLRVDSHAQWEIQQYGNVMAGMMKRVAPLSYEAWIDYDVCGARFSRAEMDLLRGVVEVSDERGRIRGDLLLRKASTVVVDAPGVDSEVAVGLSKREVEEFVEKLRVRAPVDHELDLSSAKSAAHFYEEMLAATPKIDVPAES